MRTNASVVPELTGQKTTPDSPKAGQTQAALLAPRAPFLLATLSIVFFCFPPHRVKQHGTQAKEHGGTQKPPSSSLWRSCILKPSRNASHSDPLKGSFTQK